MDCTRSRSLFSEHIDGALTPSARKELSAHLAACAACAEELRRFERSLRLLAAAPAAAPPRGLAAAILGDLAAPATAGGWGAGGATGARGARRVILGAVAAVLIVALAAMLFARELSWRSRVSDLATRLSALERDRGVLAVDLAAAARHAADLVAEREALRVEKTALVEELEATHRLETAEVASARREASAAEARSRAFEESLARSREESRRGIEALTESLAAARGETDRLAKEVERLGRALAEAKPRAAPKSPRAIDVAAAAAAAAAGPRNGAGQPAASGNVVFVDRGDRLELKVRGPRDRVIAELFVIAADEGNPDTAGLALSALDNFLGRESTGTTVETGEGQAAGLGGWLSRQVGGFAQNLGFEEAPEDQGAAGLGDRRRILKELDEIWRREKNR